MAGHREETRTPWRRASAATVVALLLPACAGGHDDDGDGASSTTSTVTTGVGAFGDLGVVCGPGDATGATDRGVSDTTIVLSTMADPGNNLVPQLGEEYFQVADVFEEWCNEAGGIAGREVAVENRDSALFEAGARTTEACETDFMLVAAGITQDDTTVQIREDCELGWIPAFALTDAARDSDLKVLPQGGSSSLESMAGPLRAIAAANPELVDHLGMYWPNSPAINSIAARAKSAAEQNGYTVVSEQQTPIALDNARPFIENLRRDGTRLLLMYGDTSQPMTSMIQDVGWEPDLVLLTNGAYDDATLDLAAAVDLPPSVMPIVYTPLELAEENVATQQFLDLMADRAPGVTVNVSHLQAWDAWMLWATAARDCGSDLTVSCVLDNAASERAWTAGGLKPPVNVDPSDPHGPECFALLRVTPDGFVYDEELTAANDGLFNCDPRNVAEV